MSKREDNRLRFKSVHLDMMVLACSNDAASDLLSTVAHVMQINDPVVDGAAFAIAGKPLLLLLLHSFADVS